VKHRLSAFLAVLVVALAVSGSALAFDCIRVSSSLQGLQQSTRTGNWTLFDFSTPTAIHDSALALAGIDLSPSQVACFQQSYSASGAPAYFALGTGVAGGKTGHGPGEVASGAPLDVVTNGKGIDHASDAGVFDALDAAAGFALSPACPA
jgi:hypothetical protein